MRWAAVGMVLAGLVGMAPLFVTGAAAQSPVQIGYVDVQRILARSSAGVAAREQIEREKVTMQKEVDGKRAEVEKLREDLEKKEQGVLQKVLQELSGVIERYGKQRGYQMIVERRGAGVLYGSPEADITDEIIKAYDQETSRAKK